MYDFSPLTNHPTWVERTIIAYSQNNVYVYESTHAYNSTTNHVEA